MAPTRIIAVEGLSGSGKSAASLAAGARSGGATILEAYVRLPRPVALRPGGYPLAADLVGVERRLLREDARRWRQAVELSGNGRLVYLDTGLLGTLTYTWGLVQLGKAPTSALDSIRSSTQRAVRLGRIGVPDRTAFIDTPPSIRRERESGDPGGHPAELRELHAQVGALERGLWIDLWAPQLGDRLAVIDGRGSVERVAAALDRLGHRPAPVAPRRRGEADRDLLRSLIQALPR